MQNKNSTNRQDGDSIILSFIMVNAILFWNNNDIRRAYMDFKLHPEYKPTGDQPQAIDKLAKGIIDGKKHQTFSGDGDSKEFIIFFDCNS